MTLVAARNIRHASFTRYQPQGTASDRHFTEIELAASVVKSTNYLYLAWDLNMGEARPMEDEEIEVVKMPLHEAVQKVLTGEINHASSMIGILMVDKLLKNESSPSSI